ncbi:MAG TPA: AgmX/PglI C-terminal domain-containing protein [Labilithrix sp.]|jgi:hypothetical protein
MRSWKVPLFVVLAGASSAVVLSVACGSPPKSPEGGGEGGSAAPSDTAASSGATPGDMGTGGTTTTSQLDASDLQGQKLTGGSRKDIETRGDGGPRTPHSGSADEPGRRRDDIKTIILTHRDEARACYDKALKDHPGIEGDIEIKWTIDPDGNVTSPEVDDGRSQIHEPSVGKCIIDVIKNIKFAKSEKGYESHARYPFNFHPKASQLKKDGGT